MRRTRNVFVISCVFLRAGNDAIRVIGAFAYIDAEVTKGDKDIPAGSRILGVAKRSGISLVCAPSADVSSLFSAELAGGDEEF